MEVREEFVSPYLAALRRRVDEAKRLRAEMETYSIWMDGDAKDAQINFRIGRNDLMKLKGLARINGLRYQTYLRNLIRREIGREEERVATQGEKRRKATSGRNRGEAGAPR